MQKKHTQTILWGLILASTMLFTKSFAVKDGEKFKDWEGKCDPINQESTEEVCGVTQTVFDKENQPVANIFIIKNKSGDKTVAFIKVPLLVNLSAGIGVAVDQKEIARLPYLTCDPAGCNAILHFDDEIEGALKKGSKMQIGLFLGPEEINLTASLSGISAALKSL